MTLSLPTARLTRPRHAKTIRLALVTMVVLLAVVCSDNGTNHADECPTRPPDPDVGISYDEAKCRGVLYGPNDFLLTPQLAVGNQMVTFSLTNVGANVNAFTISVDGSGSVDPPTVALAPGASMRLVVSGVDQTSELVVVRTSDGRVDRQRMPVWLPGG